LVLTGNEKVGRKKKEATHEIRRPVREGEKSVGRDFREGKGKGKEAAHTSDASWKSL